MRIEGRWHLFRDGVLRPVVDAAVQTPDGGWEIVRFLLDSGADRTVLDYSFLSLLRPFVLSSADVPELGGVGGKVASVFADTKLAFMYEGSHFITVNGPFSIFTNPESNDVSVLGKDVTNNFDVIYSHSQRQVVLLSTPHSYTIISRSK
jgi:hypothetical protein